MRISPFLAARRSTRSSTLQQRRASPSSAPGLSDLDPRWAGFAAAQPGASSHKGTRILVGTIAESNNVAFTEAYRLRREGVADLWMVAPGEANTETARRAASKSSPRSTDLEAAIEEAAAKAAVIVVVNPEETRSKNGAEAEGKVLDVLAAAREAGRARVVLLWNSRNAGYLFGRLAADGLVKAPKKPDLLLDAGIEEPTNGVKRIVWGKKQADGAALFIPLPVDLWIKGRSHPAGSDAIQAGPVDSGSLRRAAALLSP